MWEGEPRTDGLLRGARTDRVRQILALKNGGWSLETALELHCGLLDHAHEVREAAMEALFELAAQRPAPVLVTPARLLAYYMTTFTVASGIDLAAVRCLVDLRTAEADEIAQREQRTVQALGRDRQGSGSPRHPPPSPRG